MPPRFATISALVGHAVVGWAWCGAIMGVGRAWLPLQTTLVLHAIAGPLGFGLIAACYTRRFGSTPPLTTAATFVGVVIALDALLVAPLFERSYEMFTSLLGTWLPFLLIFICSYVGARWVRGSTARA